MVRNRTRGLEDGLGRTRMVDYPALPKCRLIAGEQISYQTIKLFVINTNKFHS
jgi:hypothetical protein